MIILAETIPLGRYDKASGNRANCTKSDFYIITNK